MLLSSDGASPLFSTSIFTGISCIRWSLHLAFFYLSETVPIFVNNMMLMCVDIDGAAQVSPVASDVEWLVLGVGKRFL